MNGWNHRIWGAASGVRLRTHAPNSCCPHARRIPKCFRANSDDVAWFNRVAQCLVQLARYMGLQVLSSSCSVVCGVAGWATLTIPSLATGCAGTQLQIPLPRSWLIFPENLRRRAKPLHSLVAAVLPDLLAVAKACVNVAKWSIITRYIQCPLPCWWLMPWSSSLFNTCSVLSTWAQPFEVLWEQW